MEKLAQPMRVLLLRWTTKERWPKKEGSEGLVERKASVYLLTLLAGCSRVGRGNVLGRERALGNVSVLAAQITSLASLRLARIAEGSLAAEVRVQVSAGSGAVAISRDWLGVDVWCEVSTCLSCFRE
jgi:hypothetical protein